jgi:hypothetical protein
MKNAIVDHCVCDVFVVDLFSIFRIAVFGPCRPAPPGYETAGENRHDINISSNDTVDDVSVGVSVAPLLAASGALAATADVGSSLTCLLSSAIVLVYD